MDRARAVVFDLDGTLLKSMENHHRSYVEIFEQRLGGIRPPSFLDVALLEGQRAPEVIEQLARTRGRDLTKAEVKSLGEEKQTRFRSMPKPEPYPGADAILANLKKAGLPLGLATGTNKENVRHMLGESASRFDVLVTGDDVTHAKPHPEPYLKAFQALGVPPAEGIVVENAPLGIQSGRASGARVVAVAHTLPVERLLEAHAVLATLADVEAWILERAR